jgi:hypothetical protein
MFQLSDCRRALDLIVCRIAFITLAILLTPSLARADYPCPGREFPVIVIDVSLGQSGPQAIACSGAVELFLATPNPINSRYNLATLTQLGGLDRLLRDGKPVKIYVINRRLMTSYTAQLNATFALPPPTLDVRGVTVPAGIGSTPGAKGFLSLSAGGSLLTTDQAIAFMLNDETFDRPFNRVADDAAAVRAQAAQIQDNIATLNARLNAMIGVGPGTIGHAETPDTDSLEAVTQSWAILGNEVAAGSLTGISETNFADWMGRADRLTTEMTELNTKLSAFPFADFYFNLKASLYTLKDNARAVYEEYDAIQRAMTILDDAATGGVYSGGSLSDRQKMELRNALRTKYPATTVTDQTLAQIVNGSNGLPRLRMNLRDARPGGVLRQRLAENIAALTAQNPAQDIDTITLAGTTVRFNGLYDRIRLLNNNEVATLRELNTVYDSYRAPFISLPYLNLGGASGNVHVNYSLIPTEQYHRYQIVNEVLAPQSNCVQSNSASTNASGGYAPCTTAPSSALAAPSATYSTSAPAQGATAAVGVVAGAAPPTPLPVITKEFDLHHFTNGALIAGIAYDSVANQTFTWQQCPVGTTQTTTPNPPCYSSPAIGTATQTYNYQLLRTVQAPVAAVGGVLLYFKPRDMFDPKIDKHAFGAMFAVSAYPLNHYFIGPAWEPKPGINLSAGVVEGATNLLPTGYSEGVISTSNPTLPSVTKFKTGAFFMLSFDAYLFKAIFTGGPFVPTIGTATPSK